MKLTVMNVALREANVTEPARYGFERWSPDSEASKHMTPDASALMGGKPVP